MRIPAPVKHLGVAAGILLWLSFFFEGLMVGSKPYRDQIGAGLEKLSFDQATRAITIAFSSYIITNAAILCCIAGALGASLGRFGYGAIPGSNLKSGYSAMGGLLRGFLVYLLWLAGVYVATADPFADPNPDKYARVAGAFSLAAFAVGYQPQARGKASSAPQREGGDARSRGTEAEGGGGRNRLIRGSQEVRQEASPLPTCFLKALAYTAAEILPHSASK